MASFWIMKIQMSFTCQLSTDPNYEIEKWETFDGGDVWRVVNITRNSSKDNVRPFAVRNADPGNEVQLLWLENTKYVHYTDYNSSIKMHIEE